MHLRTKCILICLGLCLLSGRVVGQDERTLCNMETAERLFEEEKFSTAIHSYECLLQKEVETACLIKIYYKLGKAYTYLSSYQTAKLNFNWALNLLEKEKDSNLEAKIYSGIAFAHSKLGDFQKAYDHEIIALKIAEQEKSNNNITRSYYHLGSYAQSIGNYQEALQNYLRVKDRLKDTTSNYYATLLGGIGSVYTKIGDLDKSIAYLERSAQLSVQNDWPTLLAYALGNIGEAHAKAGNFEIAVDYIGNAIDRKLELGDQTGVVDSKLQLGYLWMDQKRYARAESIFLEAIQEAEALDAKKKLLECFKALKELFSINGQFEKAFLYLDEYTKLKEVILNEDILKLIEEHNLMNETAEKDAEIRRLKDIQAERDENYRLKMIIAVSCVFLLGAFMILGYRINRSLTRKNEALAAFGKQLKQKNIELEHFAHIASHDLKEPLRTITSFTGLLGRNYVQQLDDKAQVYMDFIHKSVIHMRTLLDDLLSYARVDNTGVAAEKIGSKKLLDRALDNLNAQIEKKEAEIHIKTNSFPELEIVPSQMVQLFQNLIGNALKFSNGERPVVEVDCVPNTKGACRFSVKDNGIGIEPEHQQKIFEMFSRLHHEEAFKGSGIGLATCKKIVDRYGGRIWVESELGRGATFYFTLPNAQNEKSRTV